MVAETKRGLLIAFITCAVALTAGADMFVDWYAGSGFYKPPGDAVGIMDGGSPATVLAQLIYAPTTNTWSSATAGGGVDAGFVILDSYNASFAVDTDWAVFSQTYTGAYVVGACYGRIFQDSTVDVDDYYYNGDMFEYANLLPPSPEPAHELYDMNQDLWLGWGDALQEQVVPEPSTLALLVFGALTVVARRFRRRK
jgi:hypothetical protein